jgi:uncharacterized protein YbbC (DUF1343 family)
VRFNLKYFCSLLLVSSTLVNCQPSKNLENKFKLGADVLVEKHPDLLINKKIGLVINHTSLLSNETHILDTLLSLKVNVSAIFSPEHGLFGNFERGRNIADSIISSIPVYSLHGNVKKPTGYMLKNLDLIVYDIQDLGVRFFTYVSTLYYVLESAVENNIPMILLDRPNPNGGLNVTGPVLQSNYKSFIGLTEIPVLYGMTSGELALLYLNEFILNSNSAYELTVIEMQDWNREMSWEETEVKWIPPSPNIPDVQTAMVYPGICFLEGTNISEGRGTERPFLQIGAPFVSSEELIIEMNKSIVETYELKSISFAPISMKGKAENPKYENETCNGISVEVNDEKNFDTVTFGINLIYSLYKLYPDKLKFDNNHFDLLAGTDQLRKLILENQSPYFIINSWQEELNEFRSIRKKYLLY